jgi:putative ABC transport system permease protein
MKVLDILGYSFNAIKLRKLRAALTTLGVVIGIAAIVALLSITQGLATGVTGQLQQGLSTNALIVTSGGGGGGGFGGAGAGGGGAFGGGGGSSGYPLYVNYTDEINNLSPYIDTSFAVIQKGGYINAGGLNSSSVIYGVDFNEYSKAYAKTFVAANGTIPLSPSDNDIVVGTSVNDPGQNGTLLFSAGDDVGLVWTNTTSFPFTNESYTGHVSAVLQKVGGFGIGGPSDSGVYIPISKAESFFGTDQCQMIIVKLNTSDNAIIQNVSRTISRHFDDQVSVISSTAIISIVNVVFAGINLFLGGIAGISLVVAGVGIMNIMIASLIERTREIGILKALGMKSRTVLSIFLCESLIIGLLGAILGIVIGWGLAEGVGYVINSGFFGGGGFTITPQLTPGLIGGALAFGIGISVIFAIYPAWRASRLKPVDALRYE